MTDEERIARARPLSLEERLERAIVAVPATYPDLCMECAQTFERPLGSDGTTCLCCCGDIGDDRDRLQDDLAEMEKERDTAAGEAEEYEAERDERDAKLLKAEDHIRDLERVVRDMGTLAKQVRARLAVDLAAQWDHPDRHLLGALDEAEAAIADVLG